MEDKTAKENTGTKDGTTRDDNIPVDTFAREAIGTGGVLDEEVNGKNPAGTDEDQDWWKLHASKCAARVAREEPWAAMAGGP